MGWLKQSWRAYREALDRMDCALTLRGVWLFGVIHEPGGRRQPT